jgi:hypothetical protein
MLAGHPQSAPFLRLSSSVLVSHPSARHMSLVLIDFSSLPLYPGSRVRPHWSPSSSLASVRHLPSCAHPPCTVPALGPPRQSPSFLILTLRSSWPHRTLLVVICALTFEVVALVLAAWTAFIIGSTHRRARAQSHSLDTAGSGQEYYPLVVRTLVFALLLLAAFGYQIPLHRC